MRRAAAGDGSLVVAIDADADGLYDGFRRAHKAKVSNAVFVVGSAEELPGPLAGVAAEVRIHFPWGSLLSALLAGDGSVVGGIVDVLQPGGRLTVLTSVVEHDRIEGLARLDEAAANAIAEGVAAVRRDVRIVSVHPASAGDVAGSHSTWAKRLGVGRSRPAWVFEYQRVDISGAR